MKEIENRKDIEFLVDTFYKSVVVDDVIGSFFNEVVKLDWAKHIPVMYDFWETTLLGQGNYKGNPMQTHIQLSEKKAMTSKHFDRWLNLWEKTIEQHFEGNKALEAVSRAKQISAVMKFKIQQHTNT